MSADYFPLNTMETNPIADTWSELIGDIKREYLSEANIYPWIIGFSGGKDSTVLTHAVFEALMTISPSRRTRPIHIVSNDTLVESPLVITHLNNVSRKIEQAIADMGLPITVVRTQPDPDKTFWVLLIGKGYPRLRTH